MSYRDSTAPCPPVKQTCSFLTVSMEVINALLLETGPGHSVTQQAYTADPNMKTMD
jgi:hypothetical protein